MVMKFRWILIACALEKDLLSPCISSLTSSRPAGRIESRVADNCKRLLDGNITPSEEATNLDEFSQSCYRVSHVEQGYRPRGRQRERDRGK
jgi:hypothetical protein